MRKIKGVPLVLVIIPFLTSGCVQEKVSTIKPSNSMEKTALLKEQNASLTTISKLSKLDDNLTNNYSSTSPQTYTLDELATLIENADDTLSTNSNIEEISDDNWVELTKEEEIIETAKEYLGVKYVWAANGPNCFDCSGFTKYVYKQNGITLPRYSGHQAKVGVKVDFDELQKGDLVFFDTEHKFRGVVNHVGIYIGNGKFIHASSAKKKVIITSFEEKPFYKRRFLKGERVINSTSAYASL